MRALASPQRADYDDLDGYDNVEGQTREPLLNHKSSPTSGPAKSDVRGGHSGIWSSLVREKVFFPKVIINCIWIVQLSPTPYFVW